MYQKMCNRKPMEKKKEGMDQDLSFKKILKDVELFGKHTLISISI